MRTVLISFQERFRCRMIVDIDIFPSYYADDHTKVDYSHYGLELALYSFNTKKKTKLGTFSPITVMV